MERMATDPFLNSYPLILPKYLSGVVAEMWVDT
jgi:hypothetical protein